jgi:hypothetical protein
LFAKLNFCRFELGDALVSDVFEDLRSEDVEILLHGLKLSDASRHRVESVRGVHDGQVAGIGVAEHTSQVVTGCVSHRPAPFAMPALSASIALTMNEIGGSMPVCFFIFAWRFRIAA